MQDLDTLKRGTTDASVEDLFLRRWSPRAFAKQAVSDRELKVVFTAGGWAASCFNEQPWRFLVGRKDDSTWKRILEALFASNQEWARSAPVLYASFAKRTFTLNNQPNRVAQHDVGAASAQIALQATAVGLYVHGMVGFDPEKVRSAFKIPDDFEPVACWALGYRGDPDQLSDRLKEREIEPRQRRSLKDWVFSEWGRPAL
jgi:nitroreductase